MIEIRKQNEGENLIHGDAFPITLIIGETRRYLTLKAFEELRSKLNTFAIHDVMQSDYTPDMIAKHLDWDSYDHMKINEEHIEPQFKEAINMIFWLCKLEVPFYSA